MLSIELNHRAHAEAVAGDYIGVHVSLPAREGITSGSVMGDAEQKPPGMVESFTAQVIVLGSPTPAGFKVGYTPIFDCHTAHFPGRIAEFICKIDKATGAASDRPPSALRAGDAALITVVPTVPTSVEAVSEWPELGRFTFRDMRQTIGFGVIKAVHTKTGPSQPPSRLRPAHEGVRSSGQSESS